MADEYHPNANPSPCGSMSTSILDRQHSQMQSDRPAFRNSVSERNIPLEASPPPISRWRLKLFTLYTERYFRRQFEALRLHIGQAPALDGDRPLVIMLNHASWWDPLVGLLLAKKLFPQYRNYVPMEEAALQQHNFFRKLGVFGVQKGTATGWKTLRSTGQAILQHDRNCLWITPQSRFADVRERPLRIARGLPFLLDLFEDTTMPVVLPLALEYSFLDQPSPEVFTAFGPPVPPALCSSQQELESAMEATQDRLAEAVISRETSRFTTLIEGRSGMNGVYGLWKGMLSKIRRPTMDRQTTGLVKHQNLNSRNDSICTDAMHSDGIESSSNRAGEMTSDGKHRT